MKIFKDETSFSKPMWICIHQMWMYEGETLEELIHKLNTEWQDEKHLVG